MAKAPAGKKVKAAPAPEHERIVNELAALRVTQRTIRRSRPPLETFVEGFENPYLDDAAAVGAEPAQSADKTTSPKHLFRPALHPCTAVISPAAFSGATDLDEATRSIRQLAGGSNEVLYLDKPTLTRLGLYTPKSPPKLEILAGQGRLYATEHFWATAGKSAKTEPDVYLHVYLPAVLDKEELVRELVVTSNEETARRPNDPVSYFNLVWPASIDSLTGTAAVKAVSSSLELIKSLKNQNPSDEQVLSGLALLHGTALRKAFRAVRTLALEFHLHMQVKTDARHPKQFLTDSYLATAELNLHKDALSRRFCAAGAASVAPLWWQAVKPFAAVFESLYDASELLVRLDPNSRSWKQDAGYSFLTRVTSEMVFPVLFDEEDNVFIKEMSDADWALFVRQSFKRIKGHKKSEKARLASATGLSALVNANAHVKCLTSPLVLKAFTEISADAQAWGYLPSPDVEGEVIWKLPLPHHTIDLFVRKYNFVISFVLEKMAKAEGSSLKVTNTTLPLVDRLEKDAKLTREVASAVIAAAFPPPADFIGSTLRRLKDFSYENLNNQIRVIDALAELPWTQSDVKTPYVQEIIKLSGFDPAKATAPARPKRAKAAAGAAAPVAAPAAGSPPDSSDGADSSADERDEEEDDDAAKAQPQERKGKMKQTKEERRAVEKKVPNSADQYFLLEADVKGNRVVKSAEYVDSEDDDSASDHSGSSDIVEIIELPKLRAEAFDNSGATAALHLVSHLLGCEVPADTRAALESVLETSTLADVVARAEAMAHSVRTSWSVADRRLAREHSSQVVVKTERDVGEGGSGNPAPTSSGVATTLPASSAAAATPARDTPSPSSQAADPPGVDTPAAQADAVLSGPASNKASQDSDDGAGQLDGEQRGGDDEEGDEFMKEFLAEQEDDVRELGTSGAAEERALDETDDNAVADAGSTRGGSPLSAVDVTSSQSSSAAEGGPDDELERALEQASSRETLVPATSGLPGRNGKPVAAKTPTNKKPPASPSRMLPARSAAPRPSIGAPPSRAPAAGTKKGVAQASAATSAPSGGSIAKRQRPPSGTPGVPDFLQNFKDPFAEPAHKKKKQ
ncbi:hypothetical protein Rhopal_006054-T1 [Rhodotorula paludigena]|uniref:Uncharacterized protein n=1 Tax=Rhodotorula paludigena TaxID=86838 RepID=A0AAV5GR47_9BASI|nr:hypothetical protein Rhopal_006054-T1 [Rhodotorula paludigena]